MLSAVSHTVVRRPSGATAGLITVEFNYELSYITTESLISIHPLAPLTRWHHAVCAQSAYRVHTAIVLSGNERSRCTLDLSIAFAAVADAPVEAHLRLSLDIVSDDWILIDVWLVLALGCARGSSFDTTRTTAPMLWVVEGWPWPVSYMIHIAIDLSCR